MCCVGMKCINSKHDILRGLLQSLTIALHTVLSGGEQVERAFNLGLAAILGSGVYNFGELVSVDFCVNQLY